MSTEDNKDQGNEKDNKKNAQVVRIRTAMPSRRRAGMVFGPEPVEVDLGTLSKQQIEALQADPLLMIEQVKA